VIVDIEPGMVTIRDAEAILGLTLDVTLTPNQTRLVAMRLMHKGEHTVAAEGLVRAADQAERGNVK